MYYKDLTIFANHSEIRKSFGNVLLPAVLTDEILATLDVYPEVKTSAPVGDGTVTEGASIFVNGVLTQQWMLTPYTDEELEAQAAAVLLASKMAGIEFTDVTGSNPEPLMLSAMADDQFGLESVRRNVLAGMEIGYRFENGTVVILNASNFDNLEAVWLPFRASFF